MGFPLGLNSRDVAAIFWLAVAAAWALRRDDIRPHLIALARTGGRLAIFGPVVGLAVYVAALVLMAERAGLWEPGLAKETIYWLLGTGLVLLFNLSRVLDRDDWFQGEVRKALGAAVFVDFFVNLAVLPLPVELLLVPLVTVLIAMSAFSARRADLKSARGCVDTLLGLLGGALVAYAGIRIALDLSAFENLGTLDSLMLPVWLTLAALPYVYAIGLWAGYERAFRLMRDESGDGGPRRGAQLALVAVMGLRAHELGQLHLHPARKIARASSFREARREAKQYRAGLAAERQVVLDESARLERFAGVEGTDEEGRQLDQREFAETREVLSWIATCQMGWYSNLGDRYKADLITILEPFPGLPEDHGIVAEVSADGQSWRAWRRTISGWCFAIGAAGPPPDQWLLDGPSPPEEFPGEGGDWGERFGVTAVNW